MTFEPSLPSTNPFGLEYLVVVITLALLFIIFIQHFKLDRFIGRLYVLSRVMAYAFLLAGFLLVITPSQWGTPIIEVHGNVLMGLIFVIVAFKWLWLNDLSEEKKEDAKP